MSKRFCDVNKSYLDRVGPDRKSAIAQVDQKLSGIHHRTGRSVIDMLLGNHFRSEINVGAHMTTAEVFNAGGELIASYDSLQGWTSVPTQEECAFGRVLTQVYSQIYDAAQRELTEQRAAEGAIHPSCAVDCRA